MRNNKIPEFNYDLLKMAYDTDPRLQQIIKNFDQNSIEFSRGSIDNLTKDVDTSGSKVKQMAMQAVDLKK
jgi:hypothetical protein